MFAGLTFFFFFWRCKGAKEGWLLVVGFKMTMIGEGQGVGMPKTTD